MPKEKRSNLSNGLKGLGISLAVLAVAAGATAVLTKGFTQWGAAERLVMGGNVVQKFVVDSVTSGEALFLSTADEDVGFVANLTEGKLDINKKAILGDATTEASLAAADFEAGLAGYDVKLKEVGQLEEYVMDPEDELAKVSQLSLALWVQYDKDNIAYLQNPIKVPYFNAIRFNYKISGERLITISNTSSYAQEDEAPYFAYKKRINTITTLYDNVNLIEGTDTVLNNDIVFSSYSKLGVKDNTVEIVSIEFIDTVGGHANEFCWFSQYPAE